jgi:hypothetical protein
MKKMILLAGVALIAVGGAAYAQDEGGPRPGPMGDTTRQQAIERADRMFARLDANHDGRFTPDEAQAMRGMRRGGPDGPRGPEGPAGPEGRGERMFDHLDINHDGNISRDEFNQAHARHAGPDGAMHGSGPDGPGAAGPGGPGMRGARMFGAQGFLTQAQFRERALARFDRADADHNGVLTTAERQAARGMMRQRMERQPEGGSD